MKNIVLIGMPGAAKSTTGRAIAKKLNRPFFDGDEFYVSIYGETINETFERFGEEEFRKREQGVYATLGALDGSVIACGGGVVLSDANMQALKRNGIIALLTASAEAIWMRVSRNQNRPLLRGGGIEKIREIWNEREHLYMKYADFRVDNTHSGPERSAERIISLAEKLQNR